MDIGYVHITTLISRRNRNDHHVVVHEVLLLPQWEVAVVGLVHEHEVQPAEAEVGIILIIIMIHP